MEKEFHSLADIFPLMEGEEFETLKQDIFEQGLNNPVVLLEDKILDGRNRYRACVELGIVPDYIHFRKSDPLAYVISQNLQRRHLSETGRSMVAAKIANLKVGSNQFQASANLRTLSPVSQEEAARRMNVSVRSVTDARKVLDHGIPELIRAVESEKIVVSQAASLVNSSSETQKNIVLSVESGKTVKEARIIEHGKKLESLCEKEIDNPTGLFDVIVVDPPWPQEKIMRHIVKNHGDFPGKKQSNKDNSGSFHAFEWAAFSNKLIVGQRLHPEN